MPDASADTAGYQDGPPDSAVRSMLDDHAPRSGRMRAAPGPPEAGESRPGVGRLEAFSDGVIAIAITLLVLDLRVPSAEVTRGASPLLHALGDEWLTYLSYVLSFVGIGIIWANHHLMLRFLHRTNHVLLMLNTLFLFPVVTLPFSTSLLAEYAHGSHAEQRIAVLVYGGTFLLLAAGFNAIWYYTTHHPGLLHPGADPRAVGAITASNRLGMIAYTAAFVVGFVLPVASLIAYGLLALYYAVPGLGKPE